MAWVVEFHDKFADEFRDWRHDVQKAAATSIATLELVGPMLGRPHADTLKGSRHKNMKELRFSMGDGAHRLRVRSAPTSDSAGWCKQVRRRDGSFLQTADHNGR
jgi:hypothetical protein